MDKDKLIKTIEKISNLYDKEFLESCEEKFLYKLLVDNIIIQLKSFRRFDICQYNDGDTEIEYYNNGDYIESFELNHLIENLENKL